MILLFRNILSCFLLASNLFGLDVKYCCIRDPSKHTFNQQLLRSILDKELDEYLASRNSNIAVVDQADYLSKRMREITHALIDQGFLADAYEIPHFDQHSLISFNCFTLWEGEKNSKGSIPLTFFVYIWPSEELALKHNSSNPHNCYYSSTIHSHPIQCSFTVLKGTLVQKNYQHVARDPMAKVVCLIDEEIFRQGEGETDDLTQPVIHQLYNRDRDASMCLSLHAYGLSSAEKVMKCFRETRLECTYKKEGSEF